MVTEGLCCKCDDCLMLLSWECRKPCYQGRSSWMSRVVLLLFYLSAACCERTLTIDEERLQAISREAAEVSHLDQTCKEMVILRHIGENARTHPTRKISQSFSQKFRAVTPSRQPLASDRSIASLSAEPSRKLTGIFQMEHQGTVKLCSGLAVFEYSFAFRTLRHNVSHGFG